MNAGNFGYSPSTFFPPATQTAFFDIDSVWLGELTVDEFLANVQTAYEEDKAAGLVAPVPAPGMGG